MFGSPLPYFTDAVLRAPTIGSMLMCLAASLVGVVVFLRKQSLLGEALSHASLPGVIVGVLAAALLLSEPNETAVVAAFIIVGAFCGALLGLWVIHKLCTRFGVHSDAALCFVLASFFGVGLTLASRVQVTHTHLYRQIQVYLYGQAATMTDWHIVLYATLALSVIIAICLLYKELQTITFDRDYAASLGINRPVIETLIFLLVVLSVVIGIRCVGVVLMSAMLIAPAVAARQLTHKLYRMFIFAGGIGLLSGFAGNYLSVELSYYLSAQYPGQQLVLPTGPMIVLVSSALCIASLLFAKERGLALRLMRMTLFRFRCQQENLLKAMWRMDPEGKFSGPELYEMLPNGSILNSLILQRLRSQGWINYGHDGYQLSSDGAKRAAHIVRLHRLWELYLVSELGVAAERVHASAEEVEHIITPELEKKLTELLHHPKRDPHNQPIPSASDPNP